MITVVNDNNTLQVVLYISALSAINENDAFKLSTETKQISLLAVIFGGYLIQKQAGLPLPYEQR